jgi:hypothetical protein
MYSVYQHWDPLEVCIVGKAYAPEFYSFIKNTRVRSVMERIAQETEEDFLKLIKLLESFGVEILRPNVTNNYQDYLNSQGAIGPPPVSPRDVSAMIGSNFYLDTRTIDDKWDSWRGHDWPINPPKNKHELDLLPNSIRQEILAYQKDFAFNTHTWDHVIDKIQLTNPITFNQNINTAMITRVGRDLYFGTNDYSDDIAQLELKYSKMFPDYRCRVINTGGHSDSTYCPVKPGLIVSLHDIPTYKHSFPDWEVIYLPKSHWDDISDFLKLKKKNQGKWWVPGEEKNDDFIEFVESFFNHWLGFVEETVFDINMLVIDEKNVVCTNEYREQVYRAFERHAVTPHVVNFRHRWFWDSGLHCITSDVSRTGHLKDYFPERK